MKRVRWLALAAALAAIMSCGGNPTANVPVAASPTPAPAPAPAPPTTTPSPVAAPVAQTDPACTCTPTDPPSGDYRHDAKHVPMITDTPQEVTVADVLAWTHNGDPGFTAPRAGRELQLFHIAKAYLQNVWVVKDDCDLHMELSNTPEATAPRMIVETPIDASYCPARIAVNQALKLKGLSMTWGTVNAIPVSVVGMGFEDYDHKRGSQYVATPWELHPAVVTVLP